MSEDLIAHMGLMNKILHGYMSTHPNYLFLLEELKAEALYGLWEAIQGHNSERGAFSTYAYIVILRRLRDYVRYYFRSRQKTDNKPVVLDEAISFSDNGEWVRRLDIALDMDEMLNTLPPGHKRLMEMIYIEGYKQKDIAKMLGVVPTCICVIVKSIREHFLYGAPIAGSKRLNRLLEDYNG